MADIEYVMATVADQADVVDFANYVFSQAHRPHDFKTLLPKVYADGVENGALHFLARREGRIRALVANRLVSLRVLDRTLRAGFVGTVSVHPYSRGEGHMKRLMAMMTADARERGLDMMILGGQRQRYGYFGYESCGVELKYTVTETNLRHCLADADITGFTFDELSADRPEEIEFAHRLSQSRPVGGVRPIGEFLNIMRSWNCKTRLIRLSGEPVGYVMGEITELALTDEALLPRVIKAFFKAFGLKKISLAVAPHETQRVRALAAICEGRKIASQEMISVLNYERVIDAYLNLKASYAPLEDGRVTLMIDGETYTIEVCAGKPRVMRGGEAPERVLTALEAERLLFGLESAVCQDPAFKNWLPLPVFVSGADSF